jgi:hypothetical protein
MRIIYIIMRYNCKENLRYIICLQEVDELYKDFVNELRKNLYSHYKFNINNNNKIKIEYNEKVLTIYLNCYNNFVNNHYKLNNIYN